MFGWQDRFEYLECAACGYLRIAAIPEALARYYPSEYYAFEAEPIESGLLRHLFRLRDRYACHGRGIVGRLLNAVVENRALESVRPLCLGPRSRILDVGCGAGVLLRALRDQGFTRLEGIDPHTERDRTTGEGIPLRKATLEEVDGGWDLIMLHHVIEHMPDTRRALAQVRDLLVEGGVCLIRTPVAGCFAWTHYGTDWVQLDAPRHLCLHSVPSLHRLAEQTGLVVEKVRFDSTSFQFWGSELYRRGVSLEAARGTTFFEIFSIGQLCGYARRARRLNAQGRGDQAAFYLRKARSA